jgi:hypothetical protein
MRIDPCTRNLLAACLLFGALSLVVILDYSGYPYPAYQLWILEYNLRTQDVAGALLLMALVLIASLAPGRRYAVAFVDAISRHPWQTACVAFVMLSLGTLYVEHNHPLAQDEYAALFQSRVFAAGELTGFFPPDLMGRLIPPFYRNYFLYASFESGQVASAYWPGFALLLTPFTFLQFPWACNPLLASLALVLMGRLAARLSGEPQAAGWAMLLALASPGFTAMAITYFSATAHLLFNLAFVWLLLDRTTLRLVLAGVVGSFALILHNPVPHTLFALPWILWLALQPSRIRNRNLCALAAGYAPVALIVGVCWAVLLNQLRGEALYGMLPADSNPLHRAANFIWDWHIKLRSALELPGGRILSARFAEFVRLWNWAVPGLALLAGAGWWLTRRDHRSRLLGLSFVSTVLGYFFVAFEQGHGWGARYLHPAWSVLPVMAAIALVRFRDGGRCQRMGGYVASLAVLSLVFATSLRALQIHDYMDNHLANRPPALPGQRQIVFVAHDWPTYTADLVQNDPFLRNDVWYMMNFGAQSTTEFMGAKFPGARLVHRDRRGEVWRLEPR